MSDASPTGDESLPWYLKVLILVALLVILFVIVIDLITFAGAL
jgi:hypothetical protein